MAAGRFDRKLPLPKQGRVPVKGWFDPQDDAVDAAKVLFLIVSGDGPDAVIVNGEGTWQSADGNEWRGEAPRTGPLAGGNGTGTLQLGRARGIAVSVVIKPAMVLDGRVEWPAIETFTWCANFQFV